MSVWKKIGIIVLAILCTACVGLDAWWVSVKLYGADKVISTTYELGLQTLTDGSDSKYFIEVNYFSNANNNGLEMFEVKFNYMIDEEQNAFYSQGLQYVAKTKSDHISWEYFADKNSQQEGPVEWFKNGKIAQQVYTYNGYMTVNDGISLYNYCSWNDYETTLNSTNPITNKDFMFKIQVGDELYGMKLKGDTRNSATLQYSDPYSIWFFKGGYDYYYVNDDMNFLSSLIYNAVKDLPSTSSGAVLFEIADLFDYYACVDSSRGVYNKVESSFDCDKIINDIKNYYACSVNISANGAQKAQTDSIFKCIHENSNYNSTEDYETEDYFIGRSVIDVDETCFDLVNITDDFYALKLKNAFVSYYGRYSDKIVLSIMIDVSVLLENDIEIVGFTQDSGLNNFAIKTLQFIETLENGEVEVLEVVI